MLQQNRVSEMPFPDSALTPPEDKPTASPQRSGHTSWCFSTSVT
jgi:hypothetical protein